MKSASSSSQQSPVNPLAATWARERGHGRRSVVTNREVIEDQRLDAGAPCRRRALLRWSHESARGDRARSETSRRGPAGRHWLTSAGSIGIASPECTNTTCCTSSSSASRVPCRAVGFDLRLCHRRKFRLQPLPRLDDAIAERGLVVGVAHGEALRVACPCRAGSMCPARAAIQFSGNTTPGVARCRAAREPPGRRGNLPEKRLSKACRRRPCRIAAPRSVRGDPARDRNDRA